MQHSAWHITCMESIGTVSAYIPGDTLGAERLEMLKGQPRRCTGSMEREWHLKTWELSMNKRHKDVSVGWEVGIFQLSGSFSKERCCFVAVCCSYLKVKQMRFLGSLKEFNAECLCLLVSMDEGPVTEYIWLWVCMQICMWGCISQLCSVCWRTGKYCFWFVLLHESLSI